MKVPRLALVAMVAVGAVVGGGCRATQHRSERRFRTVEFKLAHAEPGAGRQRMALDRSEEAIYVDNAAICDRRHVRTAETQAEGGAHGISIRFTDEGRRLLAETTTHNAGRRIAVVADGHLLWAPQIREPLTADPVFLSGGSYTEEELEEVAASLRSE